MYQGRQPQPILTCYDVGDTLEGLGAPILLPRVESLALRLLCLRACRRELGMTSRLAFLAYGLEII